jgi:hypothetical protein
MPYKDPEKQREHNRLRMALKRAADPGYLAKEAEVKALQYQAHKGAYRERVRAFRQREREQRILSFKPSEYE